MNLGKGESLIILNRVGSFGKGFNYTKGVGNKVTSKIYNLQKTCSGWRIKIIVLKVKRNSPLRVRCNLPHPL